MYLRKLKQVRDGRTYVYYSLAETHRTETGQIRQRTICYLGRLDELRAPDWLRVAERLPDPAWLPKLQEAVGYRSPVGPGGRVRAVTVVPETISWTNPRRLGDIWVALKAWQWLGLDVLMRELFKKVRSKVPLYEVAAMIAVNRVVEPLSERGIYHWLPTTALPELFGIPRGRIGLNLLYRTLAVLSPHKEKVEAHLWNRGNTLFDFDNSILLYDLTSTYFEGQMKKNEKAERGYSRDHRGDCKQLTVGLAVNRVGFPQGYECLPGKTRDKDTLLPMIEKLEGRFGKARRIICFDRGMATEENLKILRATGRAYICAVRRALVRPHLAAVREGAWKVLRVDHEDRPVIEVQELPPEGGERRLLCRSAGCFLKERAILERRLVRAREKLKKLQGQVEAGRWKKASVIHRKARKAVGYTHDLRGVFSWKVIREGKSVRLEVHENAQALLDEHDLEGVYLLRTTAADLSDKELWETYMLLTRVEAAFRNLKTDLLIRPIYHQKGDRADTHVLFSVIAYALLITVQLRHRAAGGKLTGRAFLQALQSIQLADVSIQTPDGTRLRYERASIPSATQQEILDTLHWPLPEQWFPRVIGTVRSTPKNVV